MTCVSFVVVTYNRASYLKIALRSVIAQTRFEDIKEIVVVNNGSTDDTSTILEEIARYCPKLKVVTNDENLGGAGGFALGIKIALKNRPDWMCLMDDDVELDSFVLEHILLHISNKRVLACLRLNVNGTIAERASRRYDLSSPFVVNPRKQSLCDIFKYPEEMGELEKVAFSSFEGMFIPTELVSNIGLPRKEYFIFGDDCDYCIRARRAGAQIFVVRDAVLHRMIPYDSNTALHSWKARYIYRNFFILHFLYGENLWVRMKPYLLTLVLLLQPFKATKIRPIAILEEAIEIARKIRNSDPGNNKTQN